METTFFTLWDTVIQKHPLLKVSIDYSRVEEWRIAIYVKKSGSQVRIFKDKSSKREDVFAKAYLWLSKFHYLKSCS